MRPVPALLVIAAVVGIGNVAGTDRAQAQCSVFDRHPCVPPVVCSVFRRRPCVPQFYPFGENLQLTITSADADHGTNGAAAEVAPDADKDAPDAKRQLNTIRDMFDALRACWMPPPEDEERPGMQMSVRLSFKRNGQMIGAPRVTYTSPDAPADVRTVYHDAIKAALDRCTPLPFTAGLGGALAGRPIAIRFVDNRDQK